ncbi:MULTISPECIES: bifunctional riboflavin kinase/FAD synthetase [Peptoniphilus]|uniref:bifunctional riboflavin kinase/FAD synthetase n=1 Tax=Peptoniphilus TaxID=162289 RepID=UPI0001DA9CF0|nr:MULTISPECIES: bifunctional riboflavin kinase/FAD synthetase [Peptoniphilus]EFI42276.1 riboflavin biosynthesis protein RibF [Peptoniphilus sp. oral taxon 386 str. F0131]
MQVIKIDENYQAVEESIIALGNFDGVHLAHKKLLLKLVSESKKLNLKSSILIFKNHTKDTIYNKKQRLLTSNKQKFEMLRNIGIDIIYEIIFDDSIMKISPVEFIEKFLYKNLKARGIVAGYDYKFGYMAKGDIELLKNLSLKNNIKNFIIDAVIFDGIIVSSSTIRNFIEDGNIEMANKLLGYNYTITGKIIHGKNLGTKNGYPTANIQIDTNYVIPKFGVYDSDIKIKNKVYKAASNIGKNPTIENNGLRIESHILNFNKNIYGETVDLILLKFLRPESKFLNIDELFEKIKEDVNKVKNRI